MSMMMRPNPPGSARLSQRGLQACQSGSSIQSFKERERDQLSTSSTPNVYSSGLKIGVGDGGVMDEKKKRVSLSPSSSLESGGLAGSRVSSPSPIGESSSNFSSPVLAVPSSSSSSSSSPVVVGKWFFFSFFFGFCFFRGVVSFCDCYFFFFLRKIIFSY